VKRATFLCAVSDYTAHEIVQEYSLTRPKPRVIYNGVQLRRRVPIESRSDNIVVFTGTLVRKKGVLALAEAWKAVNQEVSSAELHLFGKEGADRDGNKMSELIKGIAGPQAARSLCFHGHVSWDVLSQALDRARVAVFPSFSEAFSLAPLEAMAGGCPTIATSRVSGPEMIVDGRDGLLVDPGSPADVASSIVSVLNRDDLARRLSAAGHARVKRDFEASKTVRENEQFFECCIAGFRNQSG